MATTSAVRQPGNSLRIVVVDDDESVGKALQFLLRTSGHDVRLYASAEDLLADRVDADCFLLDICLPNMNGIELAAQLRSAGSEAPIVLMTGHDLEFATQAIAQTGLPLVRKPCDEREILDAVASEQR